MVLLAQQGGENHFARISHRGHSCGGRLRSMGRRQLGCSEQAAAPRARSMGRTRKLAVTITTTPKQPPPEELEFRRNLDTAVEDKALDTAVEDKEQLAAEREEDMKFVFDAIADWVGFVAGEIIDETVDQDTGACENAESLDIWELVSTASLEDLEDAADIEESAAQPPITVPEASLTAEEPSTTFLIQLAVPETTSAEAPASGTPSRSSTPSRSVRNRRRIIGAVVRPVTPAEPIGDVRGSVMTCQRQVQLDARPVLPQRVTLTRSVSTSAMFLDLGGTEAPRVTTAIDWMARQTPSGTPVLTLERTMGKAKSLGSLHATGAKGGLGLAASKQSRKFLPVLSVARDDNKAELIAWSVNMARTKKTFSRPQLYDMDAPWPQLS